MGCKTIRDMNVNAIIIGTQKSGTTSLYYYLKQHPDIYFSEVKEITYFDNDDFYKKGINYFHSFFSNYKDQKIIATADVHLLPSATAPERVFKYNPNIKIIVLLRDPVDRAYSAYNYAKKNGWESSDVSFIKSIEKEEEIRSNKELIRKNDLLYFWNGLYHHHLTNWFNYFPKDSFFIFKDEELRNNAAVKIKELFKFLGISEHKEINTSKEYNKAGNVKSKFVQKYILNKETRSKKIIGSFLPSSIKVFIRSKVFKKLIELNKIDKENEPLHAQDRIKARLYFKDDLLKLKEELSITFND